MKKIFFIITIPILLTLLTTNLFVVFAQTQEELQNGKEAEITNSKELTAELTQETQDPKSKVVKFNLILKSNIDTDRAKLTWKLSGRSYFEDNAVTEQIISLRQGQTYKYSIGVVPAGTGISELYGKVESFQLGNSFVVTVRKNYAANEKSEIYPITDDYKNKKLMRTLTDILIYVCGGLGIFFGLFLLLKYFAHKYNEGQNVDFSKTSEDY